VPAQLQKQQLMCI